eukprot:s1638_g1.t4
MPPGTSFQLLYWLNWLVLLPGPSSALLRRHSAAVLSDPSLETCSPLVNHESFSSVEVRLGTPAQKLNLVADTGSNNVVVMSCACLLTKSCPESFGTCFRGENVSSTFVLRNASASVLGSASRESSGRGSAPESLLIEFGSGRIGAFVASDVVHVGSVRTFLEDSLLLMVKQKLSVPGPFEGILGLGQPPQGEAAAKKQVVSGFLEQANIQRFSMCFNYEAPLLRLSRHPALQNRTVMSPPGAFTCLAWDWLRRPVCSVAVRHQLRLEMLPPGRAAVQLLRGLPRQSVLYVLLVMPVVMPVLYGYSMVVGDLPYIWAVLWVIHTCLFFVLLVVGSWLYRSNSLRSFGHYIEDPCHSNDLLIMLSWLPLVTAGGPCLLCGSFQDIIDTSLLLVLGFLFVYMPLLDEPRVLPFLWVCYSGAAGARCADLRLRTSSADVEVSSFAVRVLLGEAAAHAAIRARMLYLNRTRTPLTASLLEEEAQLQMRRPKFVEYWPDRLDGDAARIVRQVRARRRQRREELTGAFVWAIFFSQSLSPDLLLHILSFLQNGDGVLGLHVNQSPSLWLRSLGQLHWGLELQGVSVGSGQISFCAPKHKQPGQRTACGMIPDSGTTLINGPREQVLQLYEEICRSWPRCMEAQVALEQELGNLTAENQTLTGVSLLQHGVPGLGTKAIIAKVLHILAGTFAASRMSNGTSAANRTQAVQRGSRRLFALDLQRNETPRRAGEATTGRQALSIQPSDTFQLLLRHCAEWIEQVNVDDELPELSFHVAGAEAAEQMLTLRPASYVLQANMDVASPHVQNILGFLPMEVFQTRPLGTRLGRAVVCWVKQATPARLRQALRWAERPPAPGGRVYCPVPGCPCADPARAPGWLNVTTMSMLTFQVRYRDRPAARATAAEDSRPAREGTCPRWLTSSRVARGRLRHVPAAARYLWGRVLAQAVAAAVHCNEGAPPRGGRRHRRTASNAGWRESAERYGIDRGQPPRYAPRALDDEQKRSLATALTREGFDRNALLATGLCPDNHDRVAALRALHPAQAMPAVDIDGVAEAAWWRSPGRPSRTSLAWRDGWAGLTGDPLGPLLFSAVLQSLAAELRALPLDLAFFYLDDDVLADVQGGCSCSATCQRNLSKCEVVGAGLLSASALTTSVLPQSLVCASDGSSWFQRNFELLGAAIGDEDFTAAHCLTRAKAAAPHKGAIGGLEDTQVSLRLLRSCAPRALHYFDSLECFAGFTGLRLAAVQLEQASRSVYGSDAAAYLASAGGSYQACCELDASYGIAPLSSDPYVVQALAAFNDFLPQPLAVETVLASKQKMLTRLLAMRPAGRSTLLPRL